MVNDYPDEGKHNSIWINFKYKKIQNPFPMEIAFIFDLPAFCPYPLNLLFFVTIRCIETQKGR